MYHYLRLMRFPLVGTAIADSWAGYLIGLPLFGEINPLSFALLALISSLLYFGGMAFNDIADIERDRTLDPTKVLPSGAISYRSAVYVATLCYLLALGTSFLFSITLFLATFTVMMVSFLYNNLLKRFRLVGSLTMGMVRFANVLVGMSLYARLETFQTELLFYPLMLFVYIFVLTMMSTMEERETGRELFMGLVVLLCVPIVGLSLVAESMQQTLVMSLMLSMGILTVGINQMRHFSSAKVKEMVKYSLGAIIPLDAIMVISRGFPLESLIVFSLLFVVLISFIGMPYARPSD